MSDQTAQVQDTGQSEEHWATSLPEGEGWTIPHTGEDGEESEISLRDHPVLQKYGSKDEAVKALVHAQKQLGKPVQGLVAPGEDASDEDRAAFQTQLRSMIGMPESVEDYTSGLNMHDVGEDSLFPKLAEVLFEHGTPQAGMQAVLDMVVENHAAIQEARKAEYDKRFEESEAALKKKYGVDDLDHHIERGELALDAVFTDEAVELIKQSGANIHPAIIESLNNVADALKLKGGKGPTGPKGGGQEPVTREEVRKMMKDPRYNDPDHRDPAFVKQVKEAVKQVSPDE